MAIRRKPLYYFQLSMKEDKKKFEAERALIQSEKKSLQDSIGQYKVKIVSLQEMMNAIRFGSKERDLDKIHEWHKKMEDAKLVEHRSRHRLMQLEEENQKLVDLNLAKNESIRQLEDEVSQKQQHLSHVAILRTLHEAVIEEIQDNIDRSSNLFRVLQTFGQLRFLTNIFYEFF